MEIIPVAITSAKYPGNRSAAARKRKVGLDRGLLIECVGFFIAALAIKFKTDPRIASSLSKNPFARCQRWIVANVLAVSTLKNGSPMVFVVFVKTNNPLLHRSSSRTYPELVFLREVGRHHQMIDNVMMKQTPEPTTRGINTV